MWSVPVSAALKKNEKTVLFIDNTYSLFLLFGPDVSRLSAISLAQMHQTNSREHEKTGQEWIHTKKKHKGKKEKILQVFLLCLWEKKICDNQTDKTCFWIGQYNHEKREIDCW